MKSKMIGLETFLLTIGLMAATLVSLAGCNQSTPSSSQSGRTYPLNISLLDKAGQYALDSQGKLKSTAQLSSADGRLYVLMYAGTEVLDKDNKPLQEVRATIDRQPPLLPDNTDIIGAVYKIYPDGSHFIPSFRLTVSYTPDDLPQGVDEGDIYVATYQDGAWNPIRKKSIDTDKHSITTTLDHASEFAVLLPLGERSTATRPVATSANPDAVKVVVAGYISHGPMQHTVKAIEDVLAKYGDKVTVTWVDLNTKDGAAYFKANDLSAHMNVMINGKYTYNVNGRDVTFQWFEGKQWTKADLDAVISDQTGKTP
jgi:hypothetical protein